LRSLGQECFSEILNFFADQTIFNLPANINCQENKLLISNYHIEEKEDIERIYLHPYEARVYKLY